MARKWNTNCFIALAQINTQLFIDLILAIDRLSRNELGEWLSHSNRPLASKQVDLMGLIEMEKTSGNSNKNKIYFKKHRAPFTNMD